MKAQTWRAKIKKSCEDAGTYQPFFDPIIDSLSVILENRDKAYEQYEKTGANPVIKYTNKGGNTNPAKNPLLVVWDDLNASALTYWRELGLTPSGLKKLNEDALKPKKRSALAEALAEFG
ncbi:MAG: P27 family phage terminase small subunit [Bacteroidaceae bacterium]|nr:P27 family phage terminase small subunit [Bacteroidaceae bacterium]